MSQQVIFRRKQRGGPAAALTPGKPYDVIDRGERYGYEKVLITNDSGKNTWYHLDDFQGYTDLEGQLTVKDYEEVIKDHQKLVRELDVLLNGENAARQASLADIVAQLRGQQKKIEPKPSEEYKHCNHHHELSPDHEVVNFGDGDFVANKLAIPLLKALNEAGLRTRSHHIDTAGQGWVTILLDNVEFEFRKVWEIHADRKKYNGKSELYIGWGLRPSIQDTEIEGRETPVK